MKSRRRWLAVLAAVVFIGLVETLSDSVLDAFLPFPFDTLLVFAVVSTVAVVAASLAFARIDRLTRSLVERNSALESRNAAVRAVYDVSLAVSGQADPEQTIASIVDHARRLLDVDAMLLALDGPVGEVHLRTWSAPPGVLQEGPAATTKMPGRSGNELDRYLRPGFEVRLEAPVVQGESRIGTLAAAARLPRPFSVADIETLAALATQVGLALEAARLQDELRALAVQGERERIARDMHDGLAQVLGYVNTKSQAVEGLLAVGRTDEARQQLAELAAAARSVYVDVREAILSLSTPVPPERGLAGALEEYTARYAESSKLAVRFQAAALAAEAPLAAAVQAEVFRIAREALTNVRKHARAGRVAVVLARQGDEVVLSVKDDGVGFEAELMSAGPESWPHHGLAGMRERAESIGGQITWRSELGSGTEVELRVPVDGSSTAAEAVPGQTTGGAGGDDGK